MTHIQIYYQPQQGGLCKLHALNAFFGKEEISISRYQSLVENYDKKLKHNKHYIGMSYNDWDFLYKGNTILTHILLDNYNTYLRYIPITSTSIETDRCNNIKNTITDINFIENYFIFCFDAGHIWGLKYVMFENILTWFKVDSIGGISKIGNDLTSIFSNKMIGFMFPVSPLTELTYRIKLIQSKNKNDNELHIDIVAELFQYFLDKKMLPEQSDKMLKFINKYK